MRERLHIQSGATDHDRHAPSRGDVVDHGHGDDRAQPHAPVGVHGLGPEARALNVGEVHDAAKQRARQAGRGGDGNETRRKARSQAAGGE